MRIACIVFQSGTYTEVQREAETYRTKFREMGHGFDILFSTKAALLDLGAFVSEKPSYIEGRYESRILVDGAANHNPALAAGTGKWINSNYDAVLFIGLCPYPTRSYGTEPHWLELYKAIKIPKIGKIVDTMPGTDWPKLAMAELDSVYYSQPAYVGDDTGAKILPTPFLIPSPGTPGLKTMNRSVIWSGGWNRVDGVVEFIHEIPKIAKHSDVSLVGIGSQYFRQRNKAHWKAAVGNDSYEELNGTGPATFHGASPSPGDTLGMYSAWAAVDLVGIGRNVDDSFTNFQGEYTTSMIEALYKGTWPVVSEQCALHSPIPKGFLRRAVVEQGDLSGVIKTIDTPLSGTALGVSAREWVTDTHSADLGVHTLLDDIEGLRS